MKYGYIKDNKVNYAGRIADGIWKGSKGIIKDGTRRTVEQVFELFAQGGIRLKEIITPSIIEGNYEDYNFIEKDGKIVLAELKSEVIANRQKQADMSLNLAPKKGFIR